MRNLFSYIWPRERVNHHKRAEKIRFLCFAFEVADKLVEACELLPPFHTAKRGKCSLSPCMRSLGDDTVSLLQDQCHSSSRGEGEGCFHSSISICTRSSWPPKHQTPAMRPTFLGDNSGDDDNGWQRWCWWHAFLGRELFRNSKFLIPRCWFIYWFPEEYTKSAVRVSQPLYVHWILCIRLWLHMGVVPGSRGNKTWFSVPCPSVSFNRRRYIVYKSWGASLNRG